MYLKYFQIVNYKNLKNARFEFGKGANTIIGENDSGKSNAVTAMRILLDDDFYYSTKRLKETDFSRSLGEWRGHWIILSAFFDEITENDLENELCRELTPEEENAAFLRSFIRCSGYGYGTVTLLIRPIKSIRKALSCAQSIEEFNKVRQGIRLNDYEFVFTSRSQTDFTNPEVYKKIVGDFSAGNCPDPDEDDAEVLGAHIDILNVWQHISMSYIDALRDADGELHKAKNPIRRIFDTLQDDIAEDDIQSIQTKIRDLNEHLSKIPQISNMGTEINEKLQDIVGLVYSPEINVESRLKEDIDSIARYLSLTPAGEDNIDELGLGHLNILYIALKLVEFEANRNHEILNIMVVEEPEAHIHTHIQRTLFDNLKVIKNYTQVIMTTHSTHISEVCNIKSVNVLKSQNRVSTVMRPTNGLDEFGEKRLDLKDLSLSECIERYLDAKRSVLLFSKGVILVEGDAEEILIPALVKQTFGVSLDELGIGIINVGSVSFEYIASVFGDERIRRHCAIITDLDAQVEGAQKGSEGAAQRGISRKEKLSGLYQENRWVKPFYAPHTFEVDFFDDKTNRKYLKAIIKKHYSRESTISKYTDALEADIADRYDAVLAIAESVGKGWLATLLAQSISSDVQIPEYIVEALSFACQEIINPELIKKMLLYALDLYGEGASLKEKVKASYTADEIGEVAKEFTETFFDDSLALFLMKHMEYASNGSV